MPHVHYKLRSNSAAHGNGLCTLPDKSSSAVLVLLSDKFSCALSRSEGSSDNCEAVFRCRDVRDNNNPSFSLRYCHHPGMNTLASVINKNVVKVILITCQSIEDSCEVYGKGFWHP